MTYFFTAFFAFFAGFVFACYGLLPVEQCYYPPTPIQSVVINGEHFERVVK